MYNLFLARAKTLALWGGIEATLFGLAFRAYRQPMSNYTQRPLAQRASS
ncbi:hypothetical protein D9611_005635 [Ephemerocybe angulata]|uniref:Uncharacterized protein n=1 Tax=Ephemerocybe angulata TaxID=980116 RepID=A0A8H5BHL6_9AGAR|nr:hypothetical protein D9611_005635 [Tulosesus angulatus]